MWQKNASWDIHGTCVADCEDLEISSADFHVKRFKHQEVAQDGQTVVSMCTRISETLRSISTSHAAKWPLQESQDEEEEEDTVFEKENGQYR